jgi:hypothetical protein
LVGRFVSDDAACVLIAVEAREVAAGDLEADAVSGQEDVRGDRQIQAELAGLARCERLRLG